MYRILLLIAVLATTIFATGCGNRMWQDTKETASDTYDYVFDTAPTARSYHEAVQIPIIDINHDAADVLYNNIKGSELSRRSPIYIKNFINQNDPNDTSIFGRVMTEQVVDRLVQRGALITTGSPEQKPFYSPRSKQK